MDNYLPHAAPLPRIEIAIYSGVWIGGVFYSAYHVYLASETFGRQLGVEGLEPGWNVIGRNKDVSDYEWRMWLPFLWELLPWFFLHHIGSELFRWFHKMELLRIWYVAVTSLFVVYYCNLIALVVILLVPSALLVAARRGGALICWFISVIFLVSLSSFQTFLLTEQQQMALYVCLAWLQLRCISFCIDWIEQKPWSQVSFTEDDKSSQILRMLSYTFYLPFMFLGPFVSFLEFENGIKSDIASWQSLKIRLLKLALNSARFLGWMAITEFCLHFIYCNAIQIHYEALPFLDAWTLNGLAYCMGQFFLNKYVVVYGLMGTLAEFDAIHAPPLPRCIAHISMYSDMWRHFDRGFYVFLRSYIYDPLIGRHVRSNYYIFHTTICFAFVYIWHGLSMNILVWSVCNFCGILLESLGHLITKFEMYEQFERNLSPQNVRRLRALATSPLFIMSALTMFFFLGGMEVGKVFLLQIINGSLIRNMVLLIFAYCMCQVSLEIKLCKRKWKTEETFVDIRKINTDKYLNS